MGRCEYYVVRLNDGEYDIEMRDKLAAYFDVAVNQCGIRGQQAADMFVASGLARAFERQDPGFVAGKSGIELVYYACSNLGVPFDESRVFDIKVDMLSADYWLGDMLASFQVRTGWKYERVFERMSYADLREMASWCNDFSEDEYTAELLEQLRKRKPSSRLAAFRKTAGLTQSQLAAAVGVSARAIQQYEQGAKSINKAALETAYRLSLVLHVDIEDLLEMDGWPGGAGA